MRQRATKPSLRVLHTAPEASALDVYIDRVLAVPGIAYGQLTGYGELGRGDHRLTIVPAGSGQESRERFDADIEDLEAELSTLAITQPQRRLGATLVDDTTPIPAPGHAKVRVLHTVPDLPTLEVTVHDGRLLSTRVRFGEATPFAEVRAGPVDLELRAEGTARPDLLFPRYTLVADNVYTFVATGLYRGVPSLAIMPLVEGARVVVPA